MQLNYNYTPEDKKYVDNFLLAIDNAGFKFRGECEKEKLLSYIDFLSLKNNNLVIPEFKFNNDIIILNTHTDGLTKRFQNLQTYPEVLLPWEYNVHDFASFAAYMRQEYQAANVRPVRICIYDGDNNAVMLELQEGEIRHDIGKETLYTLTNTLLDKVFGDDVQKQELLS